MKRSAHQRCLAEPDVRGQGSGQGRVQHREVEVAAQTKAHHLATCMNAGIRPGGHGQGGLDAAWPQRFEQDALDTAPPWLTGEPSEVSAGVGQPKRVTKSFHAGSGVSASGGQWAGRGTCASRVGTSGSGRHPAAVSHVKGLW